MKKLLFTKYFLFIFFIPHLFYCQEDSLTSPFVTKTRISHYYISGGPYFTYPILINSYRSNYFSNHSELYNNGFNEINRWGPDSSWINSFTNRAYDVNEHTYGIQGGIVIKFRAKELTKRTAPYLKIGMNYFSRNTNFIIDNSRGFSKSTYNAYFLNGSSITRDSLREKQLSLFYSSNNLNTEADFLISTYHDRPLVLYGGVGGFAGINFGGKSLVRYTTLDSLSDHDSQGQQVYYHFSKTTQEETVKNKTGFTFGAIANLGLEIKLTKPLATFIEYRFIYRSQIMYGYIQSGSTLFQFNLGFKYAIPE